MKINKVIFSLFFLLVHYLSFGQSIKSSIEITLTAPSGKEGWFVVALFDRDEGFPSDFTKAKKIRKVASKDNRGIIAFSEIDSGNYAVAAYLDENNDATLNTNLFGIPKEATGASNNARPVFRAPSFRESKFKVDAQPVILDIMLD